MLSSRSIARTLCSGFRWQEVFTQYTSYWHTLLFTLSLRVVLAFELGPIPAATKIDDVITLHSFTTDLFTRTDGIEGHYPISSPHPSSEFNPSSNFSVVHYTMQWNAYMRRASNHAPCTMTLVRSAGIGYQNCGWRYFRMPFIVCGAPTVSTCVRRLLTLG